jgi:methylmalonyl-CoA mutase N-terminal domain/subunit
MLDPAESSSNLVHDLTLVAISRLRAQRMIWQKPCTNRFGPRRVPAAWIRIAWPSSTLAITPGPSPG